MCTYLGQATVIDSTVRAATVHGPTLFPHSAAAGHFCARTPCLHHPISVSHASFQNCQHFKTGKEAMPCFHLLSMWPRGAELPRIAEDLLHHTHHTSHKKHGPHGTCAPGMIQLPPDQCQRPQPQCSQSTLGAPMACAVRSSHHDPGLFGTVALHVKVKFGRVSSIHCTCSDCMSPGRGSTGRLRHTETWKQ